MEKRTVVTEFGEYVEYSNHGYVVHGSHFCIDAYQYVAADQEWLFCPACNLKPKVWCFDNGRSTACGCWNDRYDIFSIKDESIMSVYTRTGGTSEYDGDGLRKNWNKYCESGIVPCSHEMLRAEGKW